ncbi:hypothetical protein RB195_022704 [Necator americanus]|uniref:Uncharacterized protein n=1 Tax=Necator americanus TaxID=51031 RepID=A0ABR1EGY9_NECAM
MTASVSTESKAFFKLMKGSSNVVADALSRVTNSQDRFSDGSPESDDIIEFPVSINVCRPRIHSLRSPVVFAGSPANIRLYDALVEQKSDPMCSAIMTLNETPRFYDHLSDAEKSALLALAEKCTIRNNECLYVSGASPAPASRFERLVVPEKLREPIFLALHASPLADTLTFPTPTIPFIFINEDGQYVPLQQYGGGSMPGAFARAFAPRSDTSPALHHNVLSRVVSPVRAGSRQTRFLWRRTPATWRRTKSEGHFRGGHDHRSASLPGDAEAIGRGGSGSGPGPGCTVGAVELPIRAPEFFGKFLCDVRVRVIVQQANLIELRVLLADLVGQSLQLSAVDLGSSCRVVRQQFGTVDSMNSPPDTQHDLLMDFTFHERIKHFIASAPRTLAGMVDVEDLFFISSDSGVQPVESETSGE